MKPVLHKTTKSAGVPMSWRLAAGRVAVKAGRAIGDSWKPAWQAVAAAVGLAAADCFLVFALFGVDLLSVWGFVLHFLVLAVLALLSWRITRVARMVAQYPWRYERASP